VRYEQRRQQLQPWKLGCVSGDGARRFSTTIPASVSSTLAISASLADTTTLSHAATIANAAAVADAAAAATPTIHVPVGPAVVQRQLPAADQCFRMPIWLVIKHASLRGQRAELTRLL
jgi:hypothetical protein